MFDLRISPEDELRVSAVILVRLYHSGTYLLFVFIDIQDIQGLPLFVLFTAVNAVN